MNIDKLNVINFLIAVGVIIYFLDAIGFLGVNVPLWITASLILIGGMMLRSIVLLKRGKMKAFVVSSSICFLILVLFIIQITGQRDLFTP